MIIQVVPGFKDEITKVDHLTWECRNYFVGDTNIFFNATLQSIQDYGFGMDAWIENHAVALKFHNQDEENRFFMHYGG